MICNNVEIVNERAKFYYTYINDKHLYELLSSMKS